MNDYQPIGGEEATRWSSNSRRRYLFVALGVALAVIILGVMVGTMEVTKPPTDGMNGGGDNDDCPTLPNLMDYPAAFFYEFTVVDTSRFMTTGTTAMSSLPPANNTNRYIPGHVLFPARAPGTRRPTISLLPWINNGSLATFGVTTRTTNRTAATDYSWEDATPASGQFPVILYPYRDHYGDAIRRAERVARAGFIIILIWGEGGPQPTTPPVNGGALPADIRFVKNLVKNGTFPGLAGSVAPVSFGCIGQSASGLWCQTAARGTPTPQPGDASIAFPEYDINALWQGDEYESTAPSPFQALVPYNGSIAFWSSGVSQDINIDFPLYNTSYERILYDVKGFDHIVTSMGIVSRCNDGPKECGRVFSTNVSTPYDLTDCGPFIQVDWRSLLGQCDPGDFANVGLVPNVQYTSDIGSVIPDAPTSGLGYHTILEVESYYITSYFLHSLLHVPGFLGITTTNLAPDYLDAIYYNSVPGYPANSFNLVNRRVQIDLVDNDTHSDAFYAGFQGPIVAPPGSVNIFPPGTLDISASVQFNLSFSFPMRKGDVIESVSHMYINSAGFIFPLSSAYSAFGFRAAPRVAETLLLTGSPVMACYGTQVAPIAANATYSVLNSPTEFTMTVTGARPLYQEDSGFVPLNYQCSLFPNGTRTFAFDSTPPVNIPRRDPFASNAVVADSWTVAVGWSNGRAYVNKCGAYDYDRRIRTTSWADVLRGKDGRRSDAIFEVYSGGAPAQAA